MSVFLQDWWLRPIEIESGANRIVITENGTTYNCDIPAGTYYMHNDASVHAAGTLSLPILFTSVMLGTAAANVYAMRPCTPTKSDQMSAAGIEIYALSGTDTFTVDSSTIAPDILGYNAAEGYVTTAALSVRSPYCSSAWWCSRTIVANVHGATAKRSLKTLDIAFSHSRPRDRYSLEYDENDRIRPITYEYVPAAHVHLYGAARASDAAWAGLAEPYYTSFGTPTLVYDSHNAFERVWQSLARSEPVIIAHDRAYGAWDGTLDVDAEMVKLLDPSTSIEDVASLMQATGELYRLEPIVWIDPNSDLPGYYV